MQTKLRDAIEDCIQATTQLKKPQSMQFMMAAAQLLAKCFSSGKKVLIAGNGGSLCDAMHFAEELTGFFRRKRRALPAIALADPSHLTCVGNDVGFDQVFARAIEAYGQEGDVFIGITTSGKSPNIIQAFQTAQDLNMQTLAFLGKDGGLLKGVADLEIIIDGFETSDRIQEVHMAAIHLIIEMVENLLFADNISHQHINASDVNDAIQKNGALL